MNRKTFVAAARAAFPHTLPVMAGYLVLGFGFGLLLQSKGYGVGWALLMSVFIFAGSMQYVAVDLLATGAGLISAALMTLMINARHLFYGIGMLVRYRDMGKAKPYLIFGLTDETYGLVSHLDPPEGVPAEQFYFAITLMDQLWWIIGSVAGALFGQVAALPTEGVDFAMTALFLVIVLDNLMKQETRGSTLAGMACSLLCLLIFGADGFLIPSMLLITAVLLAARRFGRCASGEGGSV